MEGMNTAGGGESVSERIIEDLKHEKLWLVWNYMPGKMERLPRFPFQLMVEQQVRMRSTKIHWLLTMKPMLSCKIAAPPVWDLRFRKMAKSGMNPKTLQYLMGHSDISVTMNVYTHISFDDAEEEVKRMEEFRKL